MWFTTSYSTSATRRAPSYSTSATRRSSGTMLTQNKRRELNEKFRNRLPYTLNMLKQKKKKLL